MHCGNEPGTPDCSAIGTVFVPRWRKVGEQTNDGLPPDLLGADAHRTVREETRPRHKTRRSPNVSKARRFNAALVPSDGVPFAALAKQEGVGPSYFTKLLRLSYLAPDITQAILDAHQPRALTTDPLQRARVCRRAGTSSTPCSVLLKPLRTQSFYPDRSLPMQSDFARGRCRHGREPRRRHCGTGPTHNFRKNYASIPPIVPYRW